jgi:hypothetical protein
MDAETSKALRLAWQALKADCDNDVDSRAIRRAISHADQTVTQNEANGPWYVAAINHYLDR